MCYIRTLYICMKFVFRKYELQRYTKIRFLSGVSAFSKRSFLNENDKNSKFAEKQFFLFVQSLLVEKRLKLVFFINYLR